MSAKYRHLAFLTVLALVYQPQQGAAEPPPRFQHISVTTIIQDAATGPHNIIESDGQGSYTNGNGVGSILTENGYNGIPWGDWQFQTYDSTTRKVNHRFDLADAVQPGDPHYQAPAVFPWPETENPQLLPSRITVKCTLLGKNMLTMAAGDGITCPMINNFQTTNMLYKLGPALSFTGYQNSLLYPETTDVLITCNNAPSVAQGGDGNCIDWSITPYLDPLTGKLEAVARLIGESTAKGKPQASLPNGGDFYMKFHIHITRP